MPEVIKYMRPSGNPIDIGDTEANREYAKLSGWTLIEDKPATEKPAPKARAKTKAKAR